MLLPFGSDDDSYKLLVNIRNLSDKTLNKGEVVYWGRSGLDKISLEDEWDTKVFSFLRLELDQNIPSLTYGFARIRSASMDD